MSINRILSAPSRHVPVGRLAVYPFYVAEGLEKNRFANRRYVQTLLNYKIAQDRRDSPLSVFTSDELADVVARLKKRSALPEKRRPAEANALTEKVISGMNALEECKPLAIDPVFMAYLDKLCYQLFLKGYRREHLEENQKITGNALDYAIGEYIEMRRIGVTPCVIARYGHGYTSARLRGIYREAESMFGAQGRSRTVARSAAYLVITGKYGSVEEAGKEYVKGLEECGSGTAASPLAKTIALMAIRKKGSSASELKGRHARLLVEAQDAFGCEVGRQGIARTAAYMVLRRRYESIAKAKLAYDTILAEAEGAFAECRHMAHAAALAVFMGKYGTVAEARGAYDEAKKAMQARFGNSSQKALKTGTALLFHKQCRTVDEAAESMGKNLARHKKKALKLVYNGYAFPELGGMKRDESLFALMPAIDILAKRFSFSNMGSEEAKSVAALSVLEQLEKGERDPREIAYCAYVDVHAVACAYSRMRTVPLDGEILKRLDGAG
jgi:hypothetical protein